MIIANPIYDLVFKTLMQEERLAKFFIEALLNEIVHDVSIMPQEYLYTKPGIVGAEVVTAEVDGKAVVSEDSLSLLRLDFIATVKMGDGSYRKVLIELQKVRKMYDVQRFRNYLGEQYKRKEAVGEDKREESLPIVTIYLLGFALPNLAPAATKVERRYLDLKTGDVLTGKSDFIEKLTHDCYVVQLPKIKKSFQSKLERILNLFEQRRFVDRNGMEKEFDRSEKGYEPEILEMADLLHFVCSDPVSKKKLEDEIEALRSFKVYEGNIREEDKKTIGKKNRVIKKQKGIIQEKESVIQEKESLIQEKERLLREAAQQLEEQKKLIEKLMGGQGS